MQGHPIGQSRPVRGQGEHSCERPAGGRARSHAASNPWQSRRLVAKASIVREACCRSLGHAAARCSSDWRPRPCSRPCRRRRAVREACRARTGQGQGPPREPRRWGRKVKGRLTGAARTTQEDDAVMAAIGKLGRAAAGQNSREWLVGTGSFF